MKYKRDTAKKTERISMILQIILLLCVYSFGIRLSCLSASAPIIFAIYLRLLRSWKIKIETALDQKQFGVCRPFLSLSPSLFLFLFAILVYVRRHFRFCHCRPAVSLSPFCWPLKGGRYVYLMRIANRFRS